MAKRYKAGTIFLDVAPSFDGVQNAIRRHVKGINRDLKNAAEQQGQEAGQAEAQARLKEAARGAGAQIALNKKVNDSYVKDSAASQRKVTAQAEKAAQDRAKLEEQMAKVRDRADARARKRESDRAKAARDAEQRARAEQARMERREREAKARAEEKAAQERARAEEKAARDRAKIEEKAAQDRAKLEEQMAEVRDRADARARKRESDEAKAAREAEQRARVEQAKADEKAARERARMERREREAKARAEEKAARDRVKLEEKAARERVKLEERAAREAAVIERQAQQVRQRELEDSGGRVGRIIRSTIGSALKDLPAAQIRADTSPAEKALSDVRARLAGLQDQRIGVDLSADEAMREVAELRTALGTISRTHDGSVRINTMAAMAALRSLDDKIDDVRRNARRPILVRVLTSNKIMGANGGLGDDGANAFRAFSAAILLVVTALTMVGPLMAVVAAGAVTLTGALVSAAMGAGVLALAFNGVFTAIQDQIKAEEDAATSAEQNAKRRRTAARQVEDAQERLADTEEDAARASEDAARRVEDAEANLVRARSDAADQIEDALERQRDAERRVQDAQEAAENAQRNLTAARREARREIEDLSLAYDGAKLDEKEARIGIAQAQERLGETRRRAASGDASAADVRDAALEVDQARLRAREATVRRRRAGADSRSAARRGVEGSEQVRDARDRVSDAEASRVDAARALQQATADVGRARADAARQVEDAEQAVTDALREQGEVARRNQRAIRDAQQAVTDANEAAREAATQTSAAATQAERSMSKLSPAGRNFASFILGLRGGFREIRDIAAGGVLPGLEKGMRELDVYGNGFRSFVDGMARAWGDSFEQMGKELADPQWQSVFETLGKDGPRQAGLFNEALMNIALTIGGLLDAFSPLTTEMLGWLAEATQGWADWATGLEGSSDFERFLDYVRRVAPEVGDFLHSIGRAFIALGVALAPFGEGLMRVFTGVFNAIADMDPKTLGLIASGLAAIFIAMQVGNGVMQLLISLLTPFRSRLAMIVTVITLVASGLIYLYQTNDKVREAINGVIDALKSLGGWLVENRRLVAGVVAAFAGLFMLWKVVSLFFALQRAAALLGITIKAAFLFNPIVLAIGALIAILIYLWNTHEGFREVVMRVWESIKTAVKAFADWFMAEAVPRIIEAAKWVGDAFLWLWRNAVRPALHLIGDLVVAVFNLIVWAWENLLWPAIKLIARAVAWLWTNYYKPYFTFIWNLVKRVFSGIVWAWENLLWPAIKLIARGVAWLWSNYFKPYFTFIWNLVKRVFAGIVWAWSNVLWPAIKLIGGGVAWLWKNYFKPYFTFIWNLVKRVFSWIAWSWSNVLWPAIKLIGGGVAWLWKKVKSSFDKINSGARQVQDTFKSVRDGIGIIWSKLVDVISGPINKALDWIEKNFLSKVRTVLKAIGAEDLAKKVRFPDSGGGGKKGTGRSMGGVPKYETGGMVAGPWKGERADNVLGVSDAGVPIARVNPREYILPVKATARIARQVGARGLEMLRRGVLPSLPGYSIGGKIQGLNKRFLQQLAAFNKAAGGRFSVNSGYRSVAHQRILYARYRSGNGPVAARPGSSQHNFGLAADLSPSNARDTHGALARKFGLAWTVPSESWHIEPTWGRSGNARAGARYNGSGGGGGFLSGLAGKVFDQGKKALDALLEKAPKDFWSQAGVAAMKKVTGVIADKVQDFVGPDGSGGGASMAGLSSSAKGNIAKGRDMARQLGWTGRHWTALRNLWQGESNWNHRAKNPSSGAYGIPQSLPASKMRSAGADWLTNPVTQIRWGLNYIKERYKNPANAYAAWKARSPHWYADGGLVRAASPRPIGGYAQGTDRAKAGWHVIGEDGPELVRTRGGEQVYNRQQTMRLAELAQQKGEAAAAPVYVQNPWTGEYLLARVDGRISQDREWHKSMARAHGG